MGGNVQGSKVHVLARACRKEKRPMGDRVDDWYAAAGAQAVSLIQRWATEIRNYHGTNWKSRFNDGSW